MAYHLIFKQITGFVLFFTYLPMAIIIRPCAVFVVVIVFPSLFLCWESIPRSQVQPYAVPLSYISILHANTVLDNAFFKSMINIFLDSHFTLILITLLRLYCRWFIMALESVLSLHTHVHTRASGFLWMYLTLLAAVFNTFFKEPFSFLLEMH